MRSHPVTPGFRWNRATGRYIDERGRFVPRADIRAALDVVLNAERDRLPQLARDLNAGRLTVGQWQTEMAAGLKRLHIVAAMAAAGGWAQLTPADYGRIGAVLRKQYAYLQNFALDVESGRQPLGPGLENRAALYTEAARGTYEAVVRSDQADIGHTQERRVLGPADHCDDCLMAAGMGWVSLGTLPGIGESACHTLCRCTFEYR